MQVQIAGIQRIVISLSKWKRVSRIAKEGDLGDSIL